MNENTSSLLTEDNDEFDFSESMSYKPGTMKNNSTTSIQNKTSSKKELPSEATLEHRIWTKLTELGYEKIESQKTLDPAIDEIMKNASKSGNGKGKFDLLVKLPDPRYLMVVECKADVKDLQKAVNEAKHYASHLSKICDVIYIGAAGDKMEIWMHAMRSNDTYRIQDENFNYIDDLIPWKKLLNVVTHNPHIQKKREIELFKFAEKIHEDLRVLAKLTEYQKPLLISGIFISLLDDAFRDSYDKYAVDELPRNWVSAIKRSLKDMNDNEKIESIVKIYEDLSEHENLSDIDRYSKGVLYYFINKIHNEIYPLKGAYGGLDLIGQFYGEFLKYTGGDKKSLGIVLTPKHITELAVEIIKVDADSRVCDICGGTGAFLIAAMDKMTKDAGADDDLIDKIKKENLIGIEAQRHMYALLVSNMKLRGDGKSNIYYDDCFKKDISHHKCNKGLINPPFSQDKSNSGKNEHELNFTIRMLDMLVPGGLGVSIMPISCITDKNNSILKQELMSKHKVVSAMSLPPDLFDPVGTVTCMLVCKAHEPHDDTDTVWFADWRNDGFVKTKKAGRCDKYDRWNDIKKGWLDIYLKHEIPGKSVKRQELKAEDEWCAEAYLKTDYEKMNDSDFVSDLKKLASHTIIDKNNKNNASMLPPKNQWKEFSITDIFTIKKGKGLDKDKLDEFDAIKYEKDEKYCIPFVSASARNNGISGYVEGGYDHYSGCITIAMNGSVGETFYQPENFIASTDIGVLKPMGHIDKFAMMFLVTILRQEKFRYSYGYKWNRARLEKTSIKLPIDDGGKPDFNLMSEYIQGMPFSSLINFDFNAS